MDGGGDTQGENSLGESFFQVGGQVEGQDGEEAVESGDNDEQPRGKNEPLREQDRFLPIANVAKIMKGSIPCSGKIAKDAKECVQECVSEFISFITSEASERCQQEKRKTINGEDILFAMSTLGFDSYVEPLKMYLQKYRESMKSDKSMMPEGEISDAGADISYTDIQPTLAGNLMEANGQQSVIYTTTFANQGATLQNIHFQNVAGM